MKEKNIYGILLIGELFALLVEDEAIHQFIFKIAQFDIKVHDTLG